MLPPILQTGMEDPDKAFRIAVGDFFSNIGLYRHGLLAADAPVIFAGGAYPTPWTRDASFNTWFAGFLAPEAAKNSLLSAVVRTERGCAVEVADQYWDRVIWAVGAWYYFLYTADADFLKFSLEVIENTLRETEEEEFDPADGLFRGGACFQDGVAGYPDICVSKHRASGFLAWAADCPAEEMRLPRGAGLPWKALSTNCLYLAAYEIADRMRRQLGMTPRHAEAAARLRSAVETRFLLPEQGKLRYLVDTPDTAEARQEGLGYAFALLAEAVGRNHWPALIDRLHTTRYGIPCVWPQFERYAVAPGVYARHAGLIWPQVNAAWCCALVHAGRRAEAWRETCAMAELASADGMFHEIYHPESGRPYGGIQEDGEAGMREWASCPRQTWAATGFLRMVLTALFGMKAAPEGISFDPRLPEACESAEIRNLPFRGMLLDVRVVPGASRVMTVDGVPAERIPMLPGKRVVVEFRRRPGF